MFLWNLIDIYRKYQNKILLKFTKVFFRFFFASASAYESSSNSWAHPQTKISHIGKLLFFLRSTPPTISLSSKTNWSDENFLSRATVANSTSKSSWKNPLSPPTRNSPPSIKFCRWFCYTKRFTKHNHQGRFVQFGLAYRCCCSECWASAALDNTVRLRLACESPLMDGGLAASTKLAHMLSGFAGKLMDLIF